MNYLVHLYLAGSDPDLQLGGLMGDFVKGRIPAGFPDRLALGLHLHRRVDSLAQASMHTRQSRQRLQSKFGHGRGIIIDIFYDHFLASSWEDYSSESLTDFTAHVYQLLHKHHARLPAGLQHIAPRMIEHNWLYSYRHREVVGRALHRIAQRLSRPLPLGDALEDLVANEFTLRQDFEHFMAEAKDFVRQELNSTINHVT